LEIAQMILLLLILAAAVGAPVFLYFRVQARQRAESERLMARIEQALGSSVKLLEVRNYYDQMAAEYKKMLDEAYKEGNRFRQDHIRRLVERLEQLKARTLDRTVRILEPQNGRQQFRRRRHRGGRRFRPPTGQAPSSPGPQAPKPPSPQPPKPPAQGG
jgi:uncharacterized protein HemX